MKSSLFFKRLWSIMGSEKLKRVTNTQSFEKWAAQELRKGNREDKQPLVPWYQRVWSRGPSKIHSSLPSYLCVCVFVCVWLCVYMCICQRRLFGVFNQAPSTLFLSLGNQRLPTWPLSTYYYEGKDSSKRLLLPTYTWKELGRLAV